MQPTEHDPPQHHNNTAAAAAAADTSATTCTQECATQQKIPIEVDVGLFGKDNDIFYFGHSPVALYMANKEWIEKTFKDTIQSISTTTCSIKNTTAYNKISARCRDVVIQTKVRKVLLNYTSIECVKVLMVGNPVIQNMTVLDVMQFNAILVEEKTNPQRWSILKSIPMPTSQYGLQSMITFIKKSVPNSEQLSLPDPTTSRCSVPAMREMIMGDAYLSVDKSTRDSFTHILIPIDSPIFVQLFYPIVTASATIIEQFIGENIKNLWVMPAEPLIHNRNCCTCGTMLLSNCKRVYAQVNFVKLVQQLNHMLRAVEECHETSGDLVF